MRLNKTTEIFLHLLDNNFSPEVFRWDGLGDKIFIEYTDFKIVLFVENGELEQVSYAQKETINYECCQICSLKNNWNWTGIFTRKVLSEELEKFLDGLIERFKNETE